MFKISDGNASETYEDWDDLILAAESWFDYIREHEWPENKEFPTPDYADVPEGDIDALQKAIDAYLEILAEAEGHKSWAGHGTYYVSAASEAGLRLDVEEVAYGENR